MEENNFFFSEGKSPTLNFPLPFLIFLSGENVGMFFLFTWTVPML